MKIAYLIGNGLDIKIGLHTSYEDFYNYYLASDSNNQNNVEESVITKLKADIKKNRYSIWADFEKGLGDFLGKVETKEESILLYRNLKEKFMDFLSLEEDSYEFTEQSQLLYPYFFKPEIFLRGNEEIGVKSYISTMPSGGIEENIITFNYTTILEKLLQFNGKKKILNEKNPSDYIGSIVHVHGDLINDDIIFGVNDKSQINKNSKLLNERSAINRFVKSECDRTYGMGIQDTCDNIISNANLICTFGLSLGITDKRWWNNIYNWLRNKSNAILIINTYNKYLISHNINKGPEYEDVINEVKDNFFINSDHSVDMNDNNLRKRIYVSIRGDLFNLTISKKERFNTR